jgi:hypothetical protein
MTTRPLPHPEFIFGANPFFEGLAPYLSWDAIPSRLEHFPLLDIDLRGIGYALREALIEGIETHFVATSELLEICSGVQILLRRALMMRNPTDKEEKIRINRVGSTDTLDELKSLRSLDGAGMLLSGITGMGKSVLLKRILDILVVEQVVTYGDSPSCEWHRMTQCYYLYIDQPSNGTRGALLKRILLELDKQLGTSYFSEHKRTNNLDTLLVVVCKLLTAHRVALLIIDENQQSNLADSPWSTEFVLFYHLLMNLGISVLLTGCPMAFDHLYGMAQVMRRFTTGGVHKMKPATSSARWWTDDFVPGIRQFNLVDRWDVDDTWRATFEHQHTAGLPGAYVALHKEAMRCALRRGGEISVVSQVDFQSAVDSPRYKEIYRIVQSLNRATVTGESEYIDIGEQEVGIKASGISSNRQDHAISEERIKKVPLSRMKNRISALQAKQTKELNAVKKSLELAQNLSSDDVRMIGVTDDLIRNMEAELSAQSIKDLTKKGQSGRTGDTAVKE